MVLFNAGLEYCSKQFLVVEINKYWYSDCDSVPDAGTHLVTQYQVPVLTLVLSTRWQYLPCYSPCYSVPGGGTPIQYQWILRGVRTLKRITKRCQYCVPVSTGPLQALVLSV